MKELTTIEHSEGAIVAAYAILDRAVRDVERECREETTYLAFVKKEKVLNARSYLFNALLDIQDARRIDEHVNG